MKHIHQLLQTHYGFDSFRPGQEEVVQSILDGQDTLALMPTGGGKSLCYQLPALALHGTTLVISPLIALMKDQVDALRARGIAASFINSSLDDSETSYRTKELLNGRTKLLYIAPERLATGFIETLKQIPIDLVAIDEAHCVSSWGHDFRPDYLTIANYVAQLPKRPIITAFTATATPEVKKDILERLELRNPQVFVRGFDRPNLRLFSRTNLNEHGRDEEVLRLVRALSGSGIVYCATRDKTQELAYFLQEHDIEAEHYHAGMDTHERTEIQEAFMSGQVRIIVATIAFGMGVDKADVRFVIHAHIPASLENYYQEAGRAGRDGKLAYCILLHSRKDLGTHQYFIHKNYKEAIERGVEGVEASRIRFIKSIKLDKVLQYAQSHTCRRNDILNYFNDTTSSRQENCHACDVCLNYEWPNSKRSKWLRKFRRHKRPHPT